MSDIYQNYDEFKKFEIVYLGKDSLPHKIRGKVHSIGDSSITICSSIEKHRAVQLPDGTNVKVYVYTDNGIYYSDSTVISTAKDEKYIVYNLTYPINNQHSQRREFFRADMRIPLIVTVVKNSLTGAKQIFNVDSKDICGNGVSFVLEEEIKNYDDIILTIQFTDKIIETNANIVYSKSKEIRGVTYYTYALTFTTISSENIDFIVKKCFLHQLRLKKM